jgi:CDP-glycerol glycerophosphotransferase
VDDCRKETLKRPPLRIPAAARRARRLAGRAVRRLQDAAVAHRLLPPTVSVIVPIYNVEQYLAECLDSLQAQTFTRFEVVVVDDGSPDSSRAIAERYAARDRRIRIVTRENGGLGAARNTGVRSSRGQYLAFVDSDDLLPPNSLEVLVASARATGSEIVVGGLRRFDGNRTWRPGWMRDVHLHRRERVTVEEFPPLLRNLYTCNKLFRHAFWKQQGLWFREGVAYEDQPLVTQLYARARSVDVLTEVVYDYRARDDQSSISQQTSSLRDLRDRVSAWHATREVLQQEMPGLYQGWLQTLFDAHFHWYLNSPGAEDDAYWSELQKAVTQLTDGAPAAVWDATSPDKRVLLALTIQDRHADALSFVGQESKRADRWPSSATERGILLHLPFFGDPRLDADLFLLRVEQMRVAHSVESFRWLADEGAPTTFEVTGWAYLPKIDLGQHDATVTVLLRGRKTRTEHEFASSGQVEPAYPPPLEDEFCDYGPGTFRARVALGEVASGGGRDQVWDVLVRVSAAGFTVTDPVTQLIRSGSAGVISATTLSDDAGLVAEWRVKEPLRFRRVPLPLRVASVELEGRVLTGTLTGPLAAEVTDIVATRAGGRVQAPLSRSGSRTSFRLALPDAKRPTLAKPERWAVDAVSADGSLQRVWIDEEPTAHARSDDRVLGVRRTGNGYLAVDEWVATAWADRLSVSPDGHLVVGGCVLGPEAEHVAITTRSKKVHSVGPRTAVDGERFEASHPLDHEAWRFGRRPLPSGEHDLTLRVWTTTGELVDIPLRMGTEVVDDLPWPVLTDAHQGRVLRGPEGRVRVSLSRPFEEVRGRRQQRLLRETYARPASLTRGVLMRSYFGEQATDNGLSIQKELQRRGSDLPVYWAVQDRSVPVPEGGIPVVVHSREWYELLFSVQYYVDNMYQPAYHEKPDGQVIVQTFHGYPFKQMGHPHWRNLGLPQTQVDAYDRRAAEWDYLVSPAGYATPLLRRDFRYGGEVLEIGYPRNDVLLSDEAETIRAQTRASLGVREGQTAVLYAPTFRDYLAKRDNRAAMADFFDFDAAADALGSDVVMLVRGHAFNARSRHRVGHKRQVVDVTDYPEVSDLYLAADAAIVDYSSLRFDFGVTGKPMIFHVPDLQRYRDTRAFLFDFEPSAPGPLVATTQEVVELLRDLDGMRARHAEQYATFRSTYLHLEDGHAGRRFVDAVFAPRGDA